MVKEIKKNLKVQIEQKKKIKSQENIFDLGFSYKKVNIDDTYPKYIYDNLNKFKDWII